MSENLIEKYPDGCQIIHEERMYPDLYHVEQGSQRLKSFENPDKARLYADIYEVLDGFEEKGTGKRGVPPTVVRAGEDVRMAYFTASMSVTYAARAFEIDIEHALEKVLQVRERAEKQRSQGADEE